MDAAVSSHNHSRRPGTTRYISTTSSALNVNDLHKTEEGVILDRDTSFAARKTFQKRARAKFLTNAMVLRLVDVGDSKLTKAYWSTWHCSSILHRKGDKLTSKYCKQRWCIVCSRIRTAQIIKQYLPAFESWEDKVFVTLTVPSCTEEALKDTIGSIKASFEVIRRKMENDFTRGKRDNPLIGVRKLEVTYNPQTGNYHPHFHLIMRDRKTADDLREHWLYLFPEASWDAQNVKQADNGSCLELCKYFTKLISSHSKERLIHVDPLNAIFESVSGDRTFQAYRVPKLPCDKTDDEVENLVAELEIDAVYEWSQVVTDWVEQTTGEPLTGYEPDRALQILVETGIVRTKMIELEGS